MSDLSIRVSLSHFSYEAQLSQAQLSACPSFHKPIWIRRHDSLKKFQFDGTSVIHVNAYPNINKDLMIDKQSDKMEVDQKSAFQCYETLDEDEEESLTISYETIDSISRKILDNFLLDLDFNSNAYDDQISKQANSQRPN